MSAESEALWRRWSEEVWNKDRAEAIDEMMASGAIAHGWGDAQVVDTPGFKAFHAKFRGAFPDIKISVDGPAFLQAVGGGSAYDGGMLSAPEAKP
jgi:hypothetical protein